MLKVSASWLARLCSLESPSLLEMTIPPSPFTAAAALQSPYQVGGSLNAADPHYVKRQADDDLYHALTAGQFCYGLNCRQMGKSSLLVQTLTRLQRSGYRCATLDITSIGSEQVTPAQWYRGVVADLWRSFQLFDMVNYKTWWTDQGDTPPVQKLHRFLREVLLEQFADDSLVIFIDEIDSVLSLGFSLDDFFALIRFCHNQRAVDSAYRRLTFAIFGVATPSDLIRDRQRTPFNIGQPILMQGFQLRDCQPLMGGLESVVADTTALFREILHWTGGQPFLTQKLCALIWQHLHTTDEGQSLPAGEESRWVEQIVRDRILHQWEFQDEPEHLRTIRDRLLRHPDRVGRVLGRYQQVLQAAAAVAVDESEEETMLLLAGLVVKTGGTLQVKNPIYSNVFNADWVHHHLQALRPYSQAFEAWVASRQQDSSRLLRGQTLQDAQAWAQGKRLSDEDYQFLAASVADDRQEMQRSLEADRAQAIAAQLQQARRNTQLQRWLLVAISLGFWVSTGLGIVAAWASWRARQSEQLARQSEVAALAASAQGWFASNQRLDALLQAVQAQRQLDRLRSPDAILSREVDAVLRKILLGINEVNRFAGHRGEVSTVAYHPQGNQIASGSADDTLKLWHPNGTLLHSLEGHRRGVRVVRYSPTGDRLASAGGEGTLKLWDPNTGEPLKTLANEAVRAISLAFSPDGQWIAAGTLEGEIRLWRSDGTQVRSFSAHDAMVRSLAFSPDGAQLVSASADTTLKLWDWQNGTELAVLNGHTATVTDVVFSPDGLQLASAGSDSTVRLWDRDGQLLHTLEGHRAAVTSVRFHPGGQMLISTGLDHDVRIWRRTREPISAYTGIAAAGKAIDFSPDGRYLVSSGIGESHEVLLWQLESPFYSVVGGHAAAVLAIALSPDGRTLASASADTTIKLWQPDGTLLRTLTGHRAPVFAVSFSPDETLVSVSMDGTVRRWRQDGTPVRTYGNREAAVGLAETAPTGERLAVRTANQTVEIWHTDGTLLDTLSPVTGRSFTLAWHPRQNAIATGDANHHIQIWDLDTGTAIALPTDHTAPLREIAFNPDGTLLASASEDHTVEIWDAAARQVVARLTDHTDVVRAVAFAPASTRAWAGTDILASAGADKTIKLWTTDGTLLTTLDHHTALVQSLAFSPDGRFLYSASTDESIIRWDLAALLPLDPLAAACAWANDYLISNPTVSDRDRQLCPTLSNP